MMPGKLPRRVRSMLLPLVAIASLGAANVEGQPSPQAGIDTLFRGNCAAKAACPLTPEGWARIRIGMSVEEAMKASGFLLDVPGYYDDYSGGEPGCNAFKLVGAPPNLIVSVRKGRISMISVGLDVVDNSEVFNTDRNVRLGDSEAKLRAAYPELEEWTDPDGEPQDYLVSSDGNGHALRFGIVSGRIFSIDAAATDEAAEEKFGSRGCGASGK